MSYRDKRAPGAKVIEDLKKAIDGGQYQAGDQLPSHGDLAEQFQVDRNTVARAIGVLRTERYVYTHQGKGTYVIEPSARSESASVASQFEQLLERFGDLERRVAALESTQADESAPRADRAVQ